MSTSEIDTLRLAVLARIDDLVLDLVRQLAEQTDLIRSPATSSSPHNDSDSRPVKRSKRALSKVTPLSLNSEAEAGAASKVCFPTKSGSGVKRFAQYLRVVELIQANLLLGRVVTKRDIFYQSLHLFSSQSASDRVIENVVRLLGCKDRVEVGIVASPRGLVSGPLTIIPPGDAGEMSVVCRVGVSNLIPTEITANIGAQRWSVNIDCDDHSLGCNEHLVVVVEKEAVFKQLVQSPSMDGGGTFEWDKVVMITGKGYPDYATRALVCLLSEFRCRQDHSVKVVGLFDGDPFGIDIHRHYVHTCPVEWIGVDIQDVSSQTDDEPNYALVQLRTDERAKAVRLLRTLNNTNDVEQCRWRDMLTKMLILGYKVEIEAAYEWCASTGDKLGLIRYIEHKLHTAT